jgi:predicted nucleotidyltransferase
MVEQKYIDYWRDRQAREKQLHQELAQQARQEVQQIVNWLVQHYPIERVILFGSLARDRFVADSDIDLAVEGLPSADYFAILAQVNQPASRWVDLKLWEDLDPHFKNRVLETGEVVYARE